MNIVVQSRFWKAFHALDRLNSWVRSARCGDRPVVPWGPQQRLRKTIYWVKTHAIVTASRVEHAQFRRVRVEQTCRTCGGTGFYHPWWDHGCDDRTICRNCHLGIATLGFIESRIHGVVWHTPADKWWSSSLDVYVPFDSFYRDTDAYALATDWGVNQPGRPMSLDEVRRDFWLMYQEFSKEVHFIVEFHHRRNPPIKSSGDLARWFEEQLATESNRGDVVPIKTEGVRAL